MMLLKLLLTLNIAQATSLPKAPVPMQKEVRLEKHGDVRVDEYYWMKDRNNPDVLNHLNAENNYFESSMKPTEKLRKKIFQEIKSHIKEDESTFPSQDGNYYYYTRFEKAKQYPIFCRKKGLKAKEEILFDVNLIAKGHLFFNAHYKISPNQQLAAFSFDSTGRNFFNIKFKDIKTGQFLKNEIKNVTGSITWAADNKTLFYVKQDPETLRWYQVYRYNLENNKSELIYEESDETFETDVFTSLTRRHIFIFSGSTLTSEVRTLDTTKPELAPQLLLEREREHEFIASEDDKYFYFKTNKNAKDFKIVRTPIDNPSFKNAEEIIPHRPAIHIDDFIVFKNHLVLASRENGLTQIEIYNKSDMKPERISFQDSAYTAQLGINLQYDTTYLRYSYQSMRNPGSVYDYDLTQNKSLLRKIKTVPFYDENNYVSQRVFATARDGQKIPISILMKKNQKLDGTAPLFIYGYGSYGDTVDPWFSASRLSLVDRGFVFALAHIRGGGEMGRYWTDNGRTLNKKNTFYDFIDCTEYLVKEKYVDSKKIVANGMSAGGLLMGAITNFRPDLYKAIIAEVPFVDVLTTMLDDSIPLTTAEYDEWGNPNDKVYYDYIKTYSPYDNVKAQPYPNLLITTALHDSQVQYWEPAKWAARLRRLNTADTSVLLKIDMQSGHLGKTGRYDQMEDEALIYSYAIDLINKSGRN